MDGSDSGTMKNDGLERSSSPVSSVTSEYDSSCEIIVDKPTTFDGVKIGAIRSTRGDGRHTFMRMNCQAC